MPAPRPLHLVTAALLAAVLAACTGASPTGPGDDDRAAAPDGATPTPVVSPTAMQTTISYDDHPDTVLDLHRPDGEASGLTVVLVHGGFWREQYRRDLMTPLVPSLLADGHVVANLEYRRVGGDGGWPTTLTDVAAGIDALADIDGIDPERVAVVGHSAGGHLAAWAASRHRLDAGEPGAAPRVVPCHVVSQAGVVVLDEAAAAGLGGGAVADLLGGEDPARLRVADPAARLPLDVPVTLVHATDDRLVPLGQSERWVELATAAGDDAELVTGSGGHFAVIDPAHELWDATRDALGGAC